jgi:hypothetical protein
VLRLIRFLLLLILVLILRIALNPLDISLGENEAFSISIIASLIGLLVLFALEVRQEPRVEFGFEEYVEGVVVILFGAMPLDLSVYAIMLIALLAGLVAHITSRYW